MIPSVELGTLVFVSEKGGWLHMHIHQAMEAGKNYWLTIRPIQFCLQVVRNLRKLVLSTTHLSDDYLPFYMVSKIIGAISVLHFCHIQFLSLLRLNFIN